MVVTLLKGEGSDFRPINSILHFPTTDPVFRFNPQIDLVLDKIGLQTLGKFVFEVMGKFKFWHVKPPLVAIQIS